MAASDKPFDESSDLIAVLKDELKNEDIQVSILLRFVSFSHAHNKPNKKNGN